MAKIKIEKSDNTVESYLIGRIRKLEDENETLQSAVTEADNRIEYVSKKIEDAKKKNDEYEKFLMSLDWEEWGAEKDKEGNPKEATVHLYIAIDKLPPHIKTFVLEKLKFERDLVKDGK